jgi:hypothetical protein
LNAALKGREEQDMCMYSIALSIEGFVWREKGELRPLRPRNAGGAMARHVALIEREKFCSKVK